VAILLAGFNLWLIWPTASATAGSSVATEQISLINANLWRDSPNSDDFRAWLQANPADIVVLQELTPAHLTAIGPVLQAQGMRDVIVVPAEDAFGIGVWSRLPVSKAQLRELGPFHLASIHTQLRTAAGNTLDLFAVHPFPPIWAAGTAARDAHLRELSTWVHEAPRSTLILAGDFNATPWSAALRELSASLQLDAGTHKQWPWPTWKPATPLGLGWLLAVPIDHVLLRGAALHTHELGPDTNSDHRPQRVVVSWTACSDKYTCPP
jgi:endonuclease/exonuclease/phosphatase (EEP) superfamily protein YafD